MASNPGPAYFLAPVTIRLRPQWFLEVHTALSSLLLKVLRQHRPPLTLMKAFPSTYDNLDSDGIHFTAVAGRDYVQWLLDQPRYFLKLVTNLLLQFICIIIMQLLGQSIDGLAYFLV